MKTLLLVGLTALGCGVTISDGQRGGNPGSGGDDGSSSPDAGSGVTVSPPDASGPTCANGRLVYLNFDGVTLKSTQVKSDATINAAFWAGATLTVPAWRAGSNTRTGDIAAITSAVTAGLAQFPVTVVTTRPAQGPYVMVVFGGSSTANFNYTTEYYAIDSLDCGDAWSSDVAWVGDIAPSNTLAADFALGAIGFGLGLSGTTDPASCMCGWGSTCDSSDVPCTFSSAAPAAPLCTGAPNPQDEVATFHKAFCE